MASGRHARRFTRAAVGQEARWSNPNLNILYFYKIVVPPEPKMYSHRRRLG
jgi:hypothetical protein